MCTKKPYAGNILRASLRELQLETGRKNQIRVHMQSLGHPVVCHCVKKTPY